MSEATRKSDTGPFSLVPEWVVYAPISDRAVRLYAVLARHADDSTLEAWPSRRTLWKLMHCSEHSLDAAVKELKSLGALSFEHRYGTNGAPTSNLWIIRRVPTDGVGQKATPPQEPTLTLGQETTPGGAGTDAQNENQLTRTKERGANGASAVPDGRVQNLVAGYVEDFGLERDGQAPPSRWRAAAGRAAKEALADGESEKDIAGCFYVIAHEGKNPTTLPHVLADSHAGRERRMK